MGMYGILKFLENNKGVWYSSAEIVNKLGINKDSVRRDLKMLRDRGQVLYKIERYAGSYGRYGRATARREVFLYKFDERVLVGISLKSYKRLVVLVVIGLALVYVMFSKRKVSAV